LIIRNYCSGYFFENDCLKRNKFHLFVSGGLGKSLIDLVFCINNLFSQPWRETAILSQYLTFFFPIIRMAHLEHSGSEREEASLVLKTAVVRAPIGTGRNFLDGVMSID
jgi:hypothetical protein